MCSLLNQPATFDSSIDRERKRLRTEVVGRIELPAVEAYVARKVSEGTLPFAELLDGRRATTAITANDIHYLVDMLRRLANDTAHGPVAIVVTDVVAYGMACVMASLIEGTVAIQPFHEVAHAEEWLGWKE